MALFGFGKKKEGSAPGACAGSCAGGNAKNARVLVLGACCKKSADSYANVKQAVEELGLCEEVCNIGDAVEIAKYGVLQTPALVIDDKVVCCGKLIRVDEAKRWIERAELRS